MAIIKCPECGGQVSSTAKNCVHCGCQITVCPDCGRVYGGRVNSCLSCGASLNCESPALKNAVKEESDKLEKRFNADARTKKTVNRICKAIEMVGTLLFFAILIYGTIKREDLVVAYISGESWNYATWHTVMICFLVLTGICDIIPEAGEDILTFYLKKRGAQWLKSEKFDYNGYLKTHLNGGDITVEVALFIVEIKDIAFMLENENEFKFDVAKIIVKLLLISACFISAAVWVVSNFNAMFAASMLGMKYDFVFNMPSFYSAVIFLCLIFVAVFVFWLRRSKKQKAWEAQKGFNQ